jgi:DNA polymerase V
MDMFTDYDALNKEKQLHAALLNVRTKYGANALLKGISLVEGATSRMRNEQIGGHRS